MGKICGFTPDTDEVVLRETQRITPDEKLIIRRTLRNAYPVCRRLHECISKTTKKFVFDPDCTGIVEKPRSEILSDCDCSEYSSAISCFCQLFRARAYTEEELQCFCCVIQAKLKEELCKRGISLEEKPPKPDFIIVPVLICAKSDESISTYSYYELCECEVEEVPPLTCHERRDLCGVCETRNRPIVFRYHKDLLALESDIFEPPFEPFKLPDLGKSEEIGKWGEFLDLVDRVLIERDLRLRKIGSCHSNLRSDQETKSQTCCDEVCSMPSRKYRFEDLDRFKYIEFFGLATFCRGLMRWKNCTTKRWNCITTHPHLVIHLPSMSYPCRLRCVSGEYQSLQNIQIGRIGWLVNKNSQVMYVCPGKANFETKCTLENFVKLARPDVPLSRLWIVENDQECLCQEVEEEYISGCESLFYTPNVYRRVRHLSAGRNGFIVPGVICKTEILIACELRTSIIGPCLKFQERLLNKHYVMSLLAEFGIRHPPFVAVSSFAELCEKMSEMVMGQRGRGERKWLVKVNCGFCGNQSALVCLDLEECYCKDDLPCYLAEVLPRKLGVNKRAYKDAKAFFEEMERQGGILMACPKGDFHTISLGCFVEHDLAKACLRTAAEVVQTPSGYGCSWNDIGYIIPQTTLTDSLMQELVLSLGDALFTEQYIGYFGVDVVVFKDENGELSYWVVDIDPYYTDLLSFDDWRRFCLDIPSSTIFSEDPTIIDCVNDLHRDSSADQRHVVCSGKLYADGFLNTSGNFFVELLQSHHIAYSHKVKTGCMICPIDPQKRAFLLFAFCRKREYALKYFVRALQALHLASVRMRKLNRPVFSTRIGDLARALKRTYDIKDEYSPLQPQIRL